jgi:hypothetical protein
VRVIGQPAREIGWPVLYQHSGLILEGGCAAYPHVEPSRFAADLTVVWWALADHRSGWWSIF